MEIPKGIRVDGAQEGEEYVLQLVKNLYSQKQAGRVWYQYLVEGLQDIGFTRIAVDKCVVYYKKSVLLESYFRNSEGDSRYKKKGTYAITLA